MENILIVEDSKMMQRTVSDYLKDLGYKKIKAVQEGSDALRIINNQQVDLAIIDIILKGEIDGIEVGQVANALNIPTIYMTEYNKAHKFNSGGLYLKKPFTKEDLFNNIQLIKYKKAIDLEMNNQMNKQKELLESLDEQAWYITADEKYGLCNKQHSGFFGIEDSYLIGKGIKKVLPLGFQKQLLLLLTLARNKRQVIKKRMFVENSKNQEKILEIKVTPRFKDNSIESYICIGKDITDEVKITKNLKQVYDIIKSSKAVVFKWKNDEFWPVEYVSENINQFGYLKTDFIKGKIKYTDIIHSEDLKSIETEVIKYTHSDEEQFQQTYRIITANGEVRWVDDWTIIIRDKNNQVTHLHGIILDVTDRVLAEEKIRANEERWKFALESSQYGIWDWNLKKEKVYFSKMWKEMLGYKVEEITSSLNEWAKRVHPEDLEMAQRKIREHIVGKTGFYEDEHRMLHKNGQYIWIKDRGKVVEWDDNGVPLRFIGTHEEITSKKESERKLKEATHKYQFLFKNAPYGIALIDLETKKAVAYNDKLVEQLGYTRKEFKDITINDYEYIEDERETRKHIERIIEKGFHEFRTIHQRKNGDLREVIVSANIIELNQQNLLYAYYRDVTEIVRMKEEFKTYIEQAPYGILVADTSGAYLEANDKATEILCYSKEEFLKMSLEAIVEKDQKNLAVAFQERLLKEGHITEEVKLLKKDGHLVDIKITAVKMTNEKLIAFLEDITQEKAMQKQLKKSEERLNLAMDAAEHGFWDWDLDTNNVYMSPRYFTMLGYAPGELSMSFETWKNLLHPEDQVSIVDQIRDKIEHGIPFAEEFRLKTKSGDWMWILGRGNSFEMDTDSNPHRAVGTHTDITERKKIEKELRKNEARYRGLVESQKDLIVRVDSHNKFTYVNDAYCDTFGKTREEIIGKSFMPLIHEDDLEDTMKAMKRIEEPPYRVYLEQRAMTVNGWRWLAWEDYAIKNEAGETVEIQGVGRDITDLKEAQIAAESANQAKSEFLANMSHEIRTPLNAVIGFSDLLEDYIEVKAGEKYLEGIKTAGENLLDLINDILDLSKIEAGKFNIEYKMTDLKDLLNDLYSVFHQQAEEKGLELSIIIDQNMPPVIYTDKIRLRQILLNLIGNALKFTEKGSVKIHVSAKMNQETIKTLTFKVIDTGIGISEDQQEKIFKAFEQKDGQSTRKYGGTGLGLAISRRLAKMMNGKLSLESRVNEGSTFILTLKDVKFDEKFVNNQRIENLMNTFTFEPANILIVDDSKTNLQVLNGWLEKYDTLNVTMVSSGEEAIEVVEETSPDLIILDVLMPGIDGYETSEIILKEHPKIPIIAFTATTKNQLEDHLEGHFVDYLLKPVGKERFIKKISKYQNTSQQNYSKKGWVIDLSQEIIDLLEDNFTSEYQACERLMVNNEIEAFAKRLINFSEEHHHKELLTYAKKLFEYASTFEIEKMEEVFKELKEILGGE
jgi:PAS domain S-box-containing protein